MKVTIASKASAANSAIADSDFSNTTDLFKKVHGCKYAKAVRIGNRVEIEFSLPMKDDLSFGRSSREDGKLVAALKADGVRVGKFLGTVLGDAFVTVGYKVI